ncbi:GlxA family transcriptional regulator [Nocardia cyriacigeorgica]|uniref:GlxA family transcriptional regulator n=1 Tax=Nocardia cyriacigeorgica TaxID=135487 RepID=UPI002454C7D4|nr:helix-turn-helix domain-containing protein [Nocardia cyriacigeorgica]
MHRVVVLAIDGVYPFELSIASRIFGTAIGPAGERLYEIVTCSPGGRPVRTEADFTVAVEHSLDVLATADTLLIPPFTCDDRERDWLADGVGPALELLRPDARLISICTASCVPAAAGMLDGHRITTHWKMAEPFQALFPRVRVDPDVLFVDDGRVLTAAGTSAAVDLCLHVLRRDHGSAVANRVAKVCVAPPWRDGEQSQYIDRPLPESEQVTTAATRAWALERLDRPLTLAQLAANANMSVRTFCRRFREETGLPPGQWLIQQRVAFARHLLEATDLPIDRIADAAGFGTAATMRQHLSASVGVSPTAYRRTFHATAEPANQPGT